MHPMVLQERYLIEIAMAEHGERLDDEQLERTIKRVVSGQFPSLARRVGTQLCMLTAPRTSSQQNASGDAGQGDDDERGDVPVRRPR